MPQGKAAGVACLQLDLDYQCRVFERPERPGFCAGLRPEAAMCGVDRQDALRLIAALELATRP
jgi:uncharacterized protein